MPSEDRQGRRLSWISRCWPCSPVLHRSRPRRLPLRTAKCWLWVWLSRGWTAWRTELVIVTPETVVGWHRRRRRIVLHVEEPSTHRSTARLGRRACPDSDDAADEPLWGAPSDPWRIAQLGLPCVRLPPHDTWSASPTTLADVATLLGQPHRATHGRGFLRRAGEPLSSGCKHQKKKDCSEARALCMTPSGWKLISVALRRGLPKRCPHCSEGPCFPCGPIMNTVQSAAWSLYEFPAIPGPSRSSAIGCQLRAYRPDLFRSGAFASCAGSDDGVGLVALLIWTSPNRWGAGIALHYLSRV